MAFAFLTGGSKIVENPIMQFSLQDTTKWIVYMTSHYTVGGALINEIRLNDAS